MILKAHPETAAFAEAVVTARANLDEADEAWRDAVEARMAATAEINFADATLDATMMALARDVNALVSGRRDDPRYQKLFARAPSTAMKPVATEAQERFVRSVTARLLEEREYETIRHHADALTTQLDALKKLVVRREELYVPEAKAAADCAVALDQARRAHNGMMPQLLLTLGNNRGLVASFFRELRRQERATAEMPTASAGAEIAPA